MRVLHTSDWHLGRTLYSQKRYEEFGLFLDWLFETIVSEEVDVLLVAGDVFDTTTPSNRAQELYYQFLSRLLGTCCRHVVIIAGNHDSASLLEAPREILKYLHVDVVGSITQDLEREVCVVTGSSGNPGLIVCAVPYLRDRDIRNMEAGEGIDEKNQKLLAGIQEHYSQVGLIAEAKQSQFLQDGYGRIPIVMMGHLFTAGGQTLDDDGVRELYVGSLAHISTDVFPSSADYVALGHLHVPQKVGGHEHIRYSGSPIPMGYGEASQTKQIVLVDCNKQGLEGIQEIPVPVFQPLERVSGSFIDITTRIKELIAINSRAWLEIDYTGSEVIPDLSTQLDELIVGSQLVILRIKNRVILAQTLAAYDTDTVLEELDIDEVFNRFLDVYELDSAERDELLSTYGEIVGLLDDVDSNAE